MAEKEKLQISEEELKVIQEQQTNYQKLIEQIGLSEIRKSILLGQVDKLLPKIEDTKKALEEKYGAININVSDGSYVEIEKEDE